MRTDIYGYCLAAKKNKLIFFIIMFSSLAVKGRGGVAELGGGTPQLDKVGQAKKWLQELKLKANVKSYFYV